MENNKKIKPNSYYSIQYWMINELGLKGLELSIYAIIYGFSRDHCGAFTGSRSYLADFTNSTKAGVDKALKSLIQKNLLEKKDFVNHGIKNCIYVAKEVANLVSYQSTELGGVANSVSQGSQLSCPNNIEDNIEDILVIEDGGTRKKDPRLDADLSKIINAYQANIGTWPRILTDDLQRWREQFSTEMLLLAISESAKNGAHKWSYIESILRRWKKDNIKTPGDFEAWEAQRKPSTGQQPKRSAAEDYDEIFRELLGGSA